MKIIDRYVLRQYLVPFGYCLGAFTMMYVVLDLFDRFPDFLAGNATVGEVLYFYGCYLFAVNGFVPFIVVVLPIALLLSSLYTLTMFARHNELTAMRASGVSLRRLLVPFMGVGLCASLFGAVTQETLGPPATKWTSDFRGYLRHGKDSADIVTGYLYHTGQTRRQWLIKRFDTKHPEQLQGVKVSQERTNGTLACEYVAERAEWLDGRWWFYGLQECAYDEHGEPLGLPSKALDKPKEMDFDETPVDLLNELEKSDFLSSWDMWRWLANRPNMSGPGRARREVDIHARLAMPWSCMVLVMLGLPAAAGGGPRRAALRSVAFGLAALFGFYFMINAGMILGKREIIWPWLAGWLPNIVFLGVGTIFTWRLR